MGGTETEDSTITLTLQSPVVTTWTTLCDGKNLCICPHTVL